MSGKGVSHRPGDGGRLGRTSSGGDSEGGKQPGGWRFPLQVELIYTPYSVERPSCGMSARETSQLDRFLAFVEGASCLIGHSINGKVQWVLGFSDSDRPARHTGTCGAVHSDSGRRLEVDTGLECMVRRLAERNRDEGERTKGRI